MEIFGFDVLQLFSFANLGAICLGTFVGLLFGAIPGLGVMTSMVTLLPLTFFMPPLASILMLLAVYQACEYGGSISSIILGIPGTPAAAATLLDGHPMAENESPGKALSYALTASTIGGFFGTLVLIFLSIPLSKFALKIGDPEFALIGVLGLMGVVSLGTKDSVKSLISVVMGLLAGTVGMDLISGEDRFTLGALELMDGINLVALAVGLFAIAEAFTILTGDLNSQSKLDSERLKGGLSFLEIKRVLKTIITGSVIGSIVGILPGLGGDVSAWFAYSLAKKRSKNPETFGKGNPEGIVAPESANNATVGGALLPLLTIGIPGSAAMALVMGTFIIHGIEPGPQVFSGDKNLVYAIFFGFALTTVSMYLFGRLLTPMFARVITIPNSILVPCILLMAIVGAYVVNQRFFDIWIAIVIGCVFYLLKQLDYSLPSFLLAFILTPTIEKGLRRALLISDGNYAVFITRPISLILLLMILAIIAIPVINRFRKKSQVQSTNEPGL